VTENFCLLKEAIIQKSLQKIHEVGMIHRDIAPEIYLLLMKDE